jgi:MFS family permease
METQMEKSERRRENSYGWVVVVAGFIITMIVYGINYSLAVLFKPLLQSFQWGRGQTSLIWAVNWMTFSVLALIIGPLTDRFGARKTMFAGSFLFSLGILFSSQATSLLHLLFLFGMLGSVGLISTLMPLAVTIIRWFDQRQGLALGLSQSFNTGTFVISPLAAWLVTSYGWQQAFIGLGVLALITVVPPTLLIRKPHGIAVTVPQGSRVSDSSQDFHLRQAIRTRAFWSLKLMALGCCISHSFLLLHLVNYLTDQGFTMSHAAMLFGLLGLASTAGRIANGFCADLYGVKPAVAGFLFSGFGSSTVSSSQPTLDVVFRNRHLGNGSRWPDDLLPYALPEILWEYLLSYRDGWSVCFWWSGDGTGRFACWGVLRCHWRLPSLLCHQCDWRCWGSPYCFDPAAT